MPSSIVMALLEATLTRERAGAIVAASATEDLYEASLRAGPRRAQQYVVMDYVVVADSSYCYFGAVVKVVEEFYGVKHKGIPFLAKAGIKTATTVARLSGGSRKRLAEAGSVKMRSLRTRNSRPKGGVANFRANLKATLLGRWLPFIQVLSLNDGAQTTSFSATPAQSTRCWW